MAPHVFPGRVSILSLSSARGSNDNSVSVFVFPLRETGYRPCNLRAISCSPARIVVVELLLFFQEPAIWVSFAEKTSTSFKLSLERRRRRKAQQPSRRKKCRRWQLFQNFVSELRKKCFKTVWDTSCKFWYRFFKLSIERTQSTQQQHFRVG